MYFWCSLTKDVLDPLKSAILFIHKQPDYSKRPRKGYDTDFFSKWIAGTYSFPSLIQKTSKVDYVISIFKVNILDADDILFVYDVRDGTEMMNCRLPKALIEQKYFFKKVIKTSLRLMKNKHLWTTLYRLIYTIREIVESLHSLRKLRRFWRRAFRWDLARRCNWTKVLSDGDTSSRVEMHFRSTRTQILSVFTGP